MIDLDDIRSIEANRWQDARKMARSVATLEWYHVTLHQLIAELEEMRRREATRGDRPEMDS